MNMHFYFTLCKQHTNRDIHDTTESVTTHARAFKTTPSRTHGERGSLLVILHKVT